MGVSFKRQGATLGANTFTGDQTIGSNGIVFNGTKMIADAANAVSLRNGTNAQALFIYNSYTDASNYEQGGVRWNSNVIAFGHFSSPGTGTNRKAQIWSGGSLAVDFATGGATSGDATFSGKITSLASSATKAGLNLPSGVAPTSPVDGDVWYDGTNLKCRLAGITKTVTVS